MGMYDYLRCEYPLPNVRMQSAEFQTKCFDCEMHRYTITSDGRLIHHTEHYESVPDNERPYFGKPEWDKGGFYQLCGSLKSIPDGDVDMNWHGFVNFYTSIGDPNVREAGDYEWFEYNAKFTDGTLVEIERVVNEK